eukprot:28317-Rhodomonas_salina.1
MHEPFSVLNSTVAAVALLLLLGSGLRMDLWEFASCFVAVGFGFLFRRLQRARETDVVRRIFGACVNWWRGFGVNCFGGLGVNCCKSLGFGDQVQLRGVRRSGVASVYGGGVAFIPGVVVGSVHGSGGASVSGSIASRFSEIALSFILAVLLFMQAALPFLLVALPFMSTLLPFAAALHPFAAAKLRHLSPLALQKSAFRAPRNGTRGRSVATSAMVSTLLCDVRYRDSIAYAAHCLAISGTEIACTAPCYAVSGTEIAYAVLCDARATFLRTCGTDLAYGATRVAGRLVEQRERRGRMP